ncbi:MAG TPA: hypothetical protein VFE46_04360 [Pirellulales bacterium]|jgi:hypothetical protein|nr:hypothetical protein [Pirellulales bacterium]
MTLKSQAQSTLSAVAPFTQGHYALNAAEGACRLSAEIVALDGLALAFEHITVVSDAMASAPIEQLKKVADALSKRLTYLLEPISPIEIDADQCVVQLRSNPPQRDDNGTRYYELLVRRGGEISLRRFQKQPGGARQTVPAQVTREVFLRLIEDFADAAR